MYKIYCSKELGEILLKSAEKYAPSYLGNLSTNREDYKGICFAKMFNTSENPIFGFFYKESNVDLNSYHKTLNFRQFCSLIKRVGNNMPINIEALNEKP